MCADGCIDADEFSICIDQGASAVTRVDGCIGLNETLYGRSAGDDANISGLGRNDACGHR